MLILAATPPSTPSPPKFQPRLVGKIKIAKKMYFFFILSSTFHIFHKNLTISEWGEGGVCIYLVRTEPNNENHDKLTRNFINRNYALILVPFNK